MYFSYVFFWNFEYYNKSQVLYSPSRDRNGKIYALKLILLIYWNPATIEVGCFLRRRSSVPQLRRYLASKTNSSLSEIRTTGVVLFQQSRATERFENVYVVVCLSLLPLGRLSAFNNDEYLKFIKKTISLLRSTMDGTHTFDFRQKL